MRFFSTTLPVILLSLFIPCIQGNTEIINFAASLAESPQIPHEWPQLDPSNRKISLNITPALDSAEEISASGVWFSLDLDNSDWSSYEKFTLRASWPASHPCDIYLKILDPLHVVGQLVRDRPLHPTRRKYARVYAVNYGVPRPSPTGEDMTELRLEPVPVTLVLEPLLFGVVPQSVVPVIMMLLVGIGIALMIAPYLVRYYDSIVTPPNQGGTGEKHE